MYSKETKNKLIMYPIKYLIKTVFMFFTLLVSFTAIKIFFPYVFFPYERRRSENGPLVKYVKDGYYLEDGYGTSLLYNEKENNGVLCTTSKEEGLNVARCRFFNEGKNNCTLLSDFKISSELRINTCTESPKRYEVVELSGGKILVNWQSNGQIYGRLYDADGNVILEKETTLDQGQESDSSDSNTPSLGTF